MKEIEWSDAIEMISPKVFKISTQDGFGSGFLLYNSENNDICSIATAAHVVSHAHAWRLPIKLQFSNSNEEIYITDQDRAILVNEDLDTAVIFIDTSNIKIPGKSYGLTPEGKYIKIGIEIGWLGFPIISPNNLCFFAGRISAYLEKSKAYLVDGVAINGVSGGPAFVKGLNDTITIIGLVSAYIPNRATNDVLPGLCMLSDVIQLQNIVKAFKSFEQAKEEELKKTSVTIPIIKGK